MKRGSTRKDAAKATAGQLLFIGGEHAAEVIPTADWRLGLREQAAADVVTARFANFRKDVQALDRHTLLSLTGLYALTGGFSEMQRKAAYPEVAELEFLQAVSLSGGSDEHGVLAPERVSGLWRELSEQAYVASGIDRADTSPLAGMARSHAAFYRNPYGDDFFDRMMLGVTNEYDARYVRDGRVAKLGQALVALRREVWGRYQAYYADSHTALRRSRAKALEVVRRLRPDITALELRELSKRSNRSVGRAVFNIIEDAAVENLFVLDEDWVRQSEGAGLPMREVLEGLALSELPTRDPSDLMASNPVWDTPVVRHPRGFALYSPITLTSFPFRALMRLMSDQPQIKPRIEKVRGWFAEQEGVRLLKEALPSAQIILGGHWERAPGETVESDILVLAANRLLIFEAKGALIPDRVRFGARDATAQFLKAIWGKATQQGAALAARLESATEPVEIKDAKGTVIMTLDPDSLRGISRFGISVEQVGPLMNSPDMLRQTGVLNETAIAAPCILLAELEQVLQIAPDEVSRLHYLSRRSALALEYQIIGDEMDVFTTYVQYGFGMLPQGERMLLLLGASYTLSDYRNQNGQVVLPSDSALRSSRFFQRVLAQAQERQSPLLLEMGLLFMDMPLHQQLDLEEQAAQAFAQKPPIEDPPVLISAVDTPVGRTSIALVMVDVFTSPMERREIGLRAAAMAGTETEAEEGISIVRLWQHPEAYDAIYFGGQTLAGRARRRLETQPASE